MTNADEDADCALVLNLPIAVTHAVFVQLERFAKGERIHTIKHHVHNGAALVQFRRIQGEHCLDWCGYTVT